MTADKYLVATRHETSIHLERHILVRIRSIVMLDVWAINQYAQEYTILTSDTDVAQQIIVATSQTQATAYTPCHGMYYASSLSCIPNTDFAGGAFRHFSLHDI